MMARVNATTSDLWGPLAVGAAAALTLGLGLSALDGIRAGNEARESAVSGFEAQSGLRDVRVVRSVVFDSCAVVELEHQALKYGTTSVALTKQTGTWRIGVIANVDQGISFDPDDASESEFCSGILDRGGR